MKNAYLDENQREIKRGKLTLVTKVDIDEQPDFSYMGEYTNQWEPYAIKRDANAREYKYFIPLLGGHKNATEAYRETRKWYTNHGHNKHEAHTETIRQMHQDYQRLENYNRGDWCMLTLTVIAIKNGIELASSSLGGIENDAGDYIDEVIDELRDEAQHDAERATLTLCANN